MNYEKEVMLKEISLQPGFVKENGRLILNKVLEQLKKYSIKSIKHIFILGCGDSYYCSLANRIAFMEATGVFVEAVEALEFSRYIVNYLPENSAVIGVSNSGTVTRTIEGVLSARQKGAITLAVTAVADSNLARAVDIPLIINTPPNIKKRENGPSVITPGTGSYIASLLGVYCVGLAFGLTFGKLKESDIDVKIKELILLAENMEATIKAVSPIAKEFAGKVDPEKSFIILGGGPNFGTAHFSLAKMFESLRKPGHCVEIEEWAHEEFFITDENSIVFVIVPPGNCRDRSLEQIQAAKDMGASVVAIGSESDKELKQLVDLVFPIKGETVESLTPFIYCIPFELFACYLADARNRAFFGFDNPKRKEVNFKQIFNSESIAKA